ncbi:hypothetical protein E2C01_004473 [Portunus trituberculatus]|uniref:Uncharacterized protein n=1 Tax=Portunus trituberculatus TaxID=210409 RepID=A0A5B7CRV5_PORTR|nr:hypothetical protein [Portunus trituberculatus]
MRDLSLGGRKLKVSVTCTAHTRLQPPHTASQALALQRPRCCLNSKQVSHTTPLQGTVTSSRTLHYCSNVVPRKHSQPLTDTATLPHTTCSHHSLSPHTTASRYTLMLKFG